MIAFKCNGCGKGVRVSDDKGGKKGKCPTCGRILIIPVMPEEPGSLLMASVDAERRAAESADARPHPPIPDLDQLVPLPQARRPVRTVRPKPDRIFSGGALLSSLFGGVLFTIWAAVSLALPCSAFSKGDVKPEYLYEFVSRVVGEFACFGLIAGMVMYHLARSVNRQGVIRWILICGVCGAVAGVLVGVNARPGTPLSRIANARTLVTVDDGIHGAVIAASIAALFASTKRRALLKSIFLPLALSATLRVIAFSFTPFKVMDPPSGAIVLFSLPPWIVLGLVSSGAGWDTAAPLVVGSLVAFFRGFQGMVAGLRNRRRAAYMRPSCLGSRTDR